jgi:hypothetical protein
MERQPVCFSPQADLVGGVVVSGIGVDVLIHRHGRASHNALCALPLILGFHQFVEAFVWLSLEGHLSAGLGRFAMWIYVSIAFVLLPVFVPIAVVALERTARRRWLMAPFAVLGTVIAGILLAAMIHGPVGVRLRPYHLAYSLRLGHATLVVCLYVVAICGAWLFSGERVIAFYGIINLVAVIVIVKLTVDGFASVWCGYAALTSAAIAIYMRRSQRILQRAELSSGLIDQRALAGG